MQFTRFTDLGLQIVLHLAAEAIAADAEDRERRRVTTSAVSAVIHASQAHVAKVISHLVDLGIVNATRGRNGGIALAESAYDFTLGQVIHRLQRNTDVFNRDGRFTAPNDLNRTLYAALNSAQEAFLDVLEEYTLRDIAPGLKTALQISDTLRAISEHQHCESSTPEGAQSSTSEFTDS